MDANALRRTFTEFFAERGHVAVPSSSLVPTHPRAPLFTNAGMNQFLPYLLGEEPAPYDRATSIQRCVRVKGKHDDIDLVGRTARHMSFFEMMGNFSFGDYFKEGAITFHWSLLTEVLGIDGDRLWITVHHSDADAAQIWRDVVGLPAERVQALGSDNFWEMGETGPCGPCSEFFIDRGEQYGEAGGPAHGSDDRYMEIGNLVFMEFDRQPDGRLEPLPRKNIDTGSGVERILPILQGVSTVWDTDVIRPLLEAGQKALGRTYGADPEIDVVLRILADHGRAATFLVADGVYPSNEERGYVLRRIIRRAVRHAFQLGVEDLVLPTVVEATIETMREAYPTALADADPILEVVEREEVRFRQTLKAGLQTLDAALAVSPVVTGDTAFRLHDTYGFPIEITREIARERSADVDEEGFERLMAEQRTKARAARRVAAADEGGTDYPALLAEAGPTRFVGYDELVVESPVVAALPMPDGTVEIFLETTPFYAEAGGQVGDTGVIETPNGRATVVDTTYAAPGLIRHVARVEGEIGPGEPATAAVDPLRRDAVRRNHTGTHLVHSALRTVLGRHVRQQGSLVAPDGLRFDFSHHAGVGEREMTDVEDLVNEALLTNDRLWVEELSYEQALKSGAIAFFGDKYGERVRVVHAGSASVELCGGTHVDTLGMIGQVRILKEQSIGSNLRRIFALTGESAYRAAQEDRRTLTELASLVRAQSEGLLPAVERLLRRQKELEAQLQAARSEGLMARVRDLAATAEDGRVVARVDGLADDQLRELAVRVRRDGPARLVLLAGSPDGNRVALVMSSEGDPGDRAREVFSAAARGVGGGARPKPGDLAIAGGRDVGAIDAALDEARRALAG